MATLFYNNWKNARREYEIVKRTHPEATLTQMGNDMIVRYDGAVEE
jgi:hypothetical protein